MKGALLDSLIVTSNQDIVSSFCDGLDDYVQEAEKWEKEKQDIPTWVEANRNIFGKPWSYESPGPKIEWGEYDIPYKILPRPHLAQFVRDQTDTKSIIKPRQAEITENQINESLYYCLTRPYTGVTHVFPTDELGDAISNEKILPAIVQSSRINQATKSKAVRRYAFDNGSMYNVTGALKTAGGRAGSKDIIIFDEVDSMPESIFGIYEELLSHSALKLRRYISTGTSPNVGIDARVKKGCEYEWEIKCPKCKKEQTFIYPDSLINYFDITQYDPDHPKYLSRLNKIYIGCRFCKEYIDRASLHYLKTSKWVAKKPSLKDIHASYYIVAPMISWKTGKEIARRFHELSDYIHQAINEIWGSAFLMSDQRLTEFDIRQCERPWQMMTTRTATMQNVAIGVDFGKYSSWLVACANGVELSMPHKRSIIYIEEINEKTLKTQGYSGSTLDHVKRVREICDLLQADGIVTDEAGMGLDRSTYLIKYFPKRAWGAFFDTAEEGRQIRKSKFLAPVWNTTQRKVTFSKVNAVKSVIGEYRRMAVSIPSIVEPTGNVLTFVKHHTALGIQPRWSTEYEREFETVVKMHKLDHFYDADLYAKIAWDKLTGNKFARSPGTIIKKGILGAVRERPIGV